MNFTEQIPTKPTKPTEPTAQAPEVLICPDKRRPEENKDKVLLAYTAQVWGGRGGLAGICCMG